MAAAVYLAGRGCPQLVGGTGAGSQAAVLQHCFYSQELRHSVAAWVAPTQVRSRDTLGSLRDIFWYITLPSNMIFAFIVVALFKKIELAHLSLCDFVIQKLQ